MKNKQEALSPPVEEEKHPISGSASSTESSPPHSLRDRKSPSPRVDFPVNSPVSFEENSRSHGFSTFQDYRSATPPENSASRSPPPRPVAANQSILAEPIVVTKVDPNIRDGWQVEEGNMDADEVGGGGGGGGEGGKGRRVRPDLSILRRTRVEKMRKRILLVCRVFEFAFCMISFSIMATDKNQGWALDSYYRYKEFRYCIAVNILGFAYSGLQAIDLTYYLASGKSLFRFDFRNYFDFFMDQIVAYLLLSASSSAATRVADWESNWGKDKFPEMARASVGCSIVAFLFFAMGSLISGYTLCRSA